MDFEFVEMGADELSFVVKLHNELAYTLQREIRDEYWDFEKLSEDSTRNYLAAYIHDPERKIFIAKTGDTVIGFLGAEVAGCHLPVSKTKKVGYISGAYVLPEYREKEIIKRLERLAVGFFRGHGLKYAELNYLTDNLPAKQAWEHLGYRTFRVQARKKI